MRQRTAFANNRTGDASAEARTSRGGGTSFTDKAKSRAQELAGAAKERIGDATDNERLRAEGANEQRAARARQAGQNVKEAGRNAFDK